MVVEYRPSEIDARSPEAQTIGEGPVYVLSDGQVATGRWTRDSADQPISFRTTAGDPIPLQSTCSTLYPSYGDPRIAAGLPAAM